MIVQVTNDPTEVEIKFPSGDGATIRAGWTEDGEQIIRIVPDEYVDAFGPEPGAYILTPAREPCKTCGWIDHAHDCPVLERQADAEPGSRLLPLFHALDLRDLA